MRNMVNKKNWKDFRETGLLLFINQILHVFGWAIVFDYESYDEEKDEGVIKDVYPARVSFRGFDNNSVSESYIKISKYLKKNIEKLDKEAKDE